MVKDLEIGRFYTDKELEELNGGCFSVDGTGGEEKGYDKYDWYISHGNKTYVMRGDIYSGQFLRGNFKIIRLVNDKEQDMQEQLKKGEK